MRLVLRYGVIALLVVAVAVLLISPFAGSLVERWSWRDTDMRSSLVFNSIRDELTLLLDQHATAQIHDLFAHIALDDRLLAVGFCDRNNKLLYRSNMMPPTFSCGTIARSGKDDVSTLVFEGHRLMVAAFRIQGRTEAGHLVILHDLAFAERRAAKAQEWTVVALLGVALFGVALASMTALIIGRRWLRSVRQAIDDIKLGRLTLVGGAAETPLASEVRQVLRDLVEETRQATDSPRIEWNPEVLSRVLANELPAAEIIAVSNREPYIHNRAGDAIALQVPASGLVAALEPVMRACGGTWVAHGNGTADRETVDANDRIAVPPDSPKYVLRRVWLTDEEQDGYYYGFANEGLWPLCHLAFVRPKFREADWAQYKLVNERFAAAVAAEAKQPSPIILMQDYHFALLPKLLRKHLPDATIVTFWHIPWPNAETFGICPWKEEIIAGLLSSSVIGFHTQFHCNNFLDTVDRFVESRIDREVSSITFRGHEVFIRPYPISIEWPPAALARQQSVEKCRAAVRNRFGLADHVRLGVGVERFDYTKGILDRLRAIDALIARCPHWKGRFVFAQCVAPTRSRLASYRDLQAEAIALADEINSRYGDETWRPILLKIRHYEVDEIFELFRAADLCIVSSLHDGMNLVAKEFVAARDDQEGVLILSTFAGASRELSEALIVNPYDADGMAGAIEQALRMPKPEQRERMRLMREMVRIHNVYRWVGQMLLDAAQIRKRQRVLQMVSQRQAATPPLALRASNRALA